MDVVGLGRIRKVQTRQSSTYIWLFVYTLFILFLGYLFNDIVTNASLFLQVKFIAHVIDSFYYIYSTISE